MFVIEPRDVSTERRVHCPKGGFVSFRYLLASEKMGFGLHKTIIPVGDWNHCHYKNHLEACYCIEGRGLLKDASTGEVTEIYPGCCYVLDQHDDHFFRATTQVTLISVFNPPCTGKEVHDENGSY
jgi:L-ectoine synthase